MRYENEMEVRQYGIMNGIMNGTKYEIMNWNEWK